MGASSSESCFCSSCSSALLLPLILPFLPLFLLIMLFTGLVWFLYSPFFSFKMNALIFNQIFLLCFVGLRDFSILDFLLLINLEWWLLYSCCAFLLCPHLSLLTISSTQSKLLFLSHLPLLFIKMKLSAPISPSTSRLQGLLPPSGLFKIQAIFLLRASRLNNQYTFSSNLV